MILGMKTIPEKDVALNSIQPMLVEKWLDQLQKLVVVVNDVFRIPHGYFHRPPDVVEDIFFGTLALGLVTFVLHGYRAEWSARRKLAQRASRLGRPSTQKET